MGAAVPGPRGRAPPPADAALLLQRLYLQKGGRTSSISGTCWG